MRVSTLILSALVTAILASAPSVAADLDITIRFAANEITVIREYFRHKQTGRKGGNKGNKHNKPLPPGIAKNLARGKPLPPGIAKQALPDDLLVRLPPVADGYERVLIAGQILLVEIATQVVHDILMDVISD